MQFNNATGETSLQLDRSGRSLADPHPDLKELTELGIDFVSLTEAFDMTTPTSSSFGRYAGGIRRV